MSEEKGRDPKTFSEGIEKKGGLNPSPAQNRPSTPPPAQPPAAPPSQPSNTGDNKK